MRDQQGGQAAREWTEDAIRRHSIGIFGKIVDGVIWTDALDENGDLLVPLEPTELVAEINSTPFILLDSHDPGKPKGKILESKLFISEEGSKFVVAIFGFYEGGDVLLFEKLGFDHTVVVPTPQKLPELPKGSGIQLAVDPREVDAQWLDQLTVNANIRIERLTLSHNAADVAQELIRVGVPYVILVWNPYVTAIATKAGEATYAAFDGWLRGLIAALSDRLNPVLDIQAHQDGCQVSFILRGKDVKKHLVAHESRPNAATNAARLIAKLKELGMPAQQLIYEFDYEGLIWYPSYAILADGRIITSSVELIAFDNLPTGLSLGLINKNLVPPLIEQTESPRGS